MWKGIEFDESIFDPEKSIYAPFVFRTNEMDKFTYLLYEYSEKFPICENLYQLFGKIIDLSYITSATIDSTKDSNKQARIKNQIDNELSQLIPGIIQDIKNIRQQLAQFADHDNDIQYRIGSLGLHYGFEAMRHHIAQIEDKKSYIYEKLTSPPLKNLLDEEKIENNLRTSC